MGQALVVEDEARIASLCGRLLARMGMTTKHVATFADAMDVVTREPESFAFAYVDVGLPDGSGLAVAEEIRRRRPTVPIVIATGALEEIRTASGVVLYKPFTLDQFTSAVTEALRAVAPSEA